MTPTEAKPAELDAEACFGCPALITKACEEYYPNGGWNARGGKGIKPCPGVLA